MGYVQRQPVPPLAPYIAHLWDCAIDPGAWRLERILPTAQAGLTINLREDETRVYAEDDARTVLRLPGASFGAPQSRSFVIDTAEQVAVMGVQFLPGGAAPFLRERMDVVADGHLAAEDLFGPSLRALRERLLDTADARARLDVLEAWLVRRVRGLRTDLAIAQALRAFDRVPEVPRIDAVARALDLSPRRFGARFAAEVGLSPKRYCRVRRFQTLLQRVHGTAAPDWAGLAADCGFADQPHLVREFRAYAGISPTAWLRRQTTYANHVPVDFSTDP